MKKTLLLIDGSNFFFRAYYALPNLRTKDGVPTGAVRGLISMVQGLMRDVPAEYAAFVADPRGKTFREDLYPEYKATRSPTPEDLGRQIPVIFDAIQKLGIPFYQIPGFEADDTIGTLAKRAQKEDFDVVIATGDKDYAQLVNEQIILINTMGDDNSWLNAAGVEEKFGVPPSKIIDYLALKGDAIDNVPGVEKCGDKTAARLLSQYGSLDEIIAQADTIKGKLGENIRKALGFLPLGRELVTIKTDVDLSKEIPSLEDLRLKEPDKDALLELYTRLEFRKWAAELKNGKNMANGRSEGEAAERMLDLFAEPAPNEAPASQSGAEELTPKTLTVIQNEEEARRLVSELEKLIAGPGFSLFLLPSEENVQAARVCGAAFGAEDGRTWYVPVSSEVLIAEGLSSESFCALFKPILEHQKPIKSGFDTKSMRHILANEGISLSGIADDVLLESYVFEAHRSHSLEKLSFHWLKWDLALEETVLGKGVKKKTFPEIAVDGAAAYASDRVYTIVVLNKALKAALSQDPALDKIYRTLELPLSGVLFKMERAGVQIDSKLLNLQTAELNARCEALEARAHEVAGEVFKLSSPKQLGEILFEKMGVLVAGQAPKKTLSGNYSTNEEVLSELAADYPLAKIALEYRTLNKLVTTYTDKLPKLTDKEGRVHTTFEQAVAVTGRLSSTNPNLQNIPIRSEEGKRVREAFIARKGCKLVSADYSQIELRIMAHLSEDGRLIEAFKKGADIHRATAAEVLGKDPELVSADERRMAKVINFGLMYGMSAFGLAKNLGIERSAAKDYIDRYFARYPQVSGFIEGTRKKANEKGFVETVFGRRLWVPEVHATGARKAAAERAAINAPLQGTAADLIKMSMLEVQKWLMEKNLSSRLILQIHDELIIEAPENEVELVCKELPEIMSSVAELKVPLIAEVGVGDNWEAAH